MGLFSWIKEHVVDPVVNTVKAIVKNPVALLVAVGVGIVNPALGLRMLATMAVSNIFGSFTKKPDTATDGQQAQQGNPTVLQPNTQNKLPFVYGRAVFSPAIVDAKISGDNQTMWYCLALCEAPDQGESTIAINNVYIDGKTCVFDTDGVSVKQFILEALNADGSHQTDDKVKNNIQIHFYRGNPSTNATPLVTNDVSAMSLMTDSSIAANARWKGTEYMADTIFMIVKLTYNQDAGITGLGNIVVDISNNQNGIDDGYKPGSAMLDYLTNSRYGAGLSLDMVDAQSFTDLDAYADEIITFTAEDGNGATQPRYRFNGMVDTTQVIMNNLLSMADSCDAFIQYNESKGRWAAIANKAYDQAPNQLSKNQLFVLDDNNIMGGVNVTPLDLNSTPNMVQSSYSNWKIKGQITDVYAHTPQRLLNKLEPINQLTMKYQFVNDSVRAQYLSNRKLEQVRADYIVDLVADYSAIQVDAGDVVLLTYQPYGARDYHIVNIFSDPVAKTITVLFDTAEVHPFQAGGRIGISDCKPASFNGSYIIISATDNSVTLSADNQDAFVSGGTIYSGLSWSNKPFRVLQVNENRGDDGTLTVKLHMNEYSDQVYDNFTIKDFTPPGKNYLMDGGILGKPDAPTIVDPKPADTVPNFKVSAFTPAQGVTMALEFWYSTTEALDPVTNNYKLYDTQYNSSASNYGQTQEEITSVSGLEAGLYYWRVRAIGTARKSEFSDSVSLDWAPVVPSAVGNTAGNNGDSAMKIVALTPDGTNWAPTTRGIDPPGGISLVTQANPGAIHVNFSTTISCDNDSMLSCNLVEVWKESTKPAFSNKIYCMDSDSSGNMVAAGSDGIVYYSTNGGVTWDTSDIIDFTGGTTLDIKGVGFTGTSTRVYGAFDGLYSIGSRHTIDPTSGVISNTSTIQYNIRPEIGDYHYVSITDVKTSFTSATILNNGKIALTGLDGQIYYDSGDLHSQMRGSTMYLHVQLTVSSTGTLQSLNKINKSGTIAIGTKGTIMIGSGNSWVTRMAYYSDGITPVLSNLFGIAEDTNGNTVIVGEKGLLMFSSNGGGSWTVVSANNDSGSKIITNIKSIAYGNGYWVAVGDKGVILKSSNLTNWTYQTNSWTDRNLNVVEYVASTNTFAIGGDGNTFLTASGNDPTFTQCTAPSLSSAVSAGSTKTRLYYRGSYGPSEKPAGQNNKGVFVSGYYPVPPVSRVTDKNGNSITKTATVSSTIIDTDYIAGETVTYYLVVGNMNGNAISPSFNVYAGGSVITATEYKQ